MYKMRSDSIVFLSGHRGLLGTAVHKAIIKAGVKNILTVDRKNLDLRNFIEVQRYLTINKPDLIINCAAKVGGIKANTKFPAEFRTDNLMIQNNLIESAHVAGISNFVFIGSNCIDEYYELDEVPQLGDKALCRYLDSKIGAG